MAKKLKNVLVNSVDLCKQGANQRAFICLKKSVEEGNHVDLKTSIIQNVCKELNITIEDVCKALGFSIQEEENQQQKIKKAMQESLLSVLQDESKTAEQKQQIVQKSVNEFFDTIYDFAKEEQQSESKTETEQEDENMDINKMTEDDKAVYEELKKKYELEKQQETQAEQKELHPEVKKALQETEIAKKELEELKKSLELKEVEGIAKQYEIIGKSTEELAPKLYELKKSNEQAYHDYIAMLDEMVSMTQASGIFKEYGSSRAGAGSQKQQAEQKIQELMKSDTAMTYEQAFTRVCEENTELKKALEY